MASGNKPVTKFLSVGIGTITLVLLVIVIWIDVATNMWQQTVILSGVAAGLLTFALTALFLDGAVSRREHRKWAPVTRLALTDLLHTIADKDNSDVRRGKVVARSLPVDVEPTMANLDALLVSVMEERDDITTVLARWAQFLASSADVRELMIHIADLAENLDYIRDEAVDIEDTVTARTVAASVSAPTSETLAQTTLQAEEVARLAKYVRAYNKSMRLAIEEILAIQESLLEEN